MVRKRARYTISFFVCLIFLSFISLVAGSDVGKKLVFVNPVTDMDTKIPSQEAREQIGVGLPASPQTQKCFRAHQGLYNERATCIAEQGDYIQIFYDISTGFNIVYGFDQDTHEPLNTFWVKKEQVLFFDQIQDKEVEKVIPDGEYAGKPTIVLRYPWNNFSVGTRFFYNSLHDKEDLYCIQYPDYKKKIVVTTYIPKKYALKEISLMDESQARFRFVKLINQLIDSVAELTNDTQVIPYVWGGSSFIWSHQKDESDFYQQDGVWRRWSENNKQYTGYDCSEFVMRMAQIAGIYFPWKTSWAIREKKRVLTQEDILENGDIIWMPGHVMVVSDLENNELIEARSYGSGFGCVHRIKVSEFFDGIDTYQDLVAAYHAHKKIKYKNKSGIVSGQEYEFQFLKLID